MGSDDVFALLFTTATIKINRITLTWLLFPKSRLFYSGQDLQTSNLNHSQHLVHVMSVHQLHLWSIHAIDHL